MAKVDETRFIVGKEYARVGSTWYERGYDNRYYSIVNFDLVKKIESEGELPPPGLPVNKDIVTVASSTAITSVVQQETKPLPQPVTQTQSVAQTQQESTSGLKNINVNGKDLQLYEQENTKGLSTGTTLLLQRVNKKAFDGYKRLLDARGLPSSEYSAEYKDGSYRVAVGVYSIGGQFTPIYDHLQGNIAGVSAVDSEFRTQIDRDYESTLTSVKKTTAKDFNFSQTPRGTAIVTAASSTTQQPQQPQQVTKVSDTTAEFDALSAKLQSEAFDNLSNKELEDYAKTQKEMLDEFNIANRDAINNGTLTPEQEREWKALQFDRQALLQQAEKRGLLKGKPQCVKKESDNSYTFKDTPECEQFVNSVIGNNLAALAQKKYSMPDPCGTSEMAKINTQLQKFFITLKGIKKYGNLYVNGIVNKTSNLVSLVRSTSTIIASVLKGLVQRFRNYVLYKIRRGIIDVIDKLFPNLASQLKNTVIQKIVDSILCKFKDIIKGLKDLVIDFLFELIGKVANAPFCMAEQFTNALVNNLGASIDKAIGPVLDEISDILGGATKFAGQIFEALDFIIGFESFLCAKPNCPELKEYAAGPWGGPSPTNPNAFEKFLASPDLDAGEATQFINDTLNNTLGLGFLDKGVGGESIGAAPGSVTDCSTAPFRCGPPTVEFFGGGGLGAVGSAVVDTTGQILGVDLVYGGSNYTRPPFVTFMDSCGRGEYASGYTKINDNGQITEVVMVNNGSGYMNTVDGTTEFDEDPADTTIPFPVEQKVTDYVVCLKEIQVVSTGIGYQPTDEITITPDIPNLRARVKMTEAGQIIAIDVLEEACNLTTIPEITINSLTGGGLEVRPILTFTRIEDFDRLAGAPAPQDLVRVIDCVS